MKIKKYLGWSILATIVGIPIIGIIWGMSKNIVPALIAIVIVIALVALIWLSLELIS